TGQGLTVAVAASAALMLVPLAVGPLQHLLSIVPPTPSGLAVAVGLAAVPALAVAATRPFVRRPTAGR
ncbi:MAG: hypothetical protein WB797_08265, partial [Nocardioides sp.]